MHHSLCRTSTVRPTIGHDLTWEVYAVKFIPNQKWQVINGWWGTEKEILLLLNIYKLNWARAQQPVILAVDCVGAQDTWVLVVLTRTTRSQNACAKALHGAGGWKAPLTEGGPSGLCGRRSHQPSNLERPSWQSPPLLNFPSASVRSVGHALPAAGASELFWLPSPQFASASFLCSTWKASSNQTPWYRCQCRTCYILSIRWWMSAKQCL